MKAPFVLENMYWKNILAGKREELEVLIDQETVLKVDDKYIVGRQIIDFLMGMCIESYVINNMQVVVSEKEIVQTIYDFRNLIKGEPDCAYYISNTWMCDEKGEPQEKLRFTYMISR